jgi:hypothetical protein
MQDSSEVVGMVVNSELAANQLGNPLTGPQLGAETKSERSLQYHFYQAAPLLRRKLCWTPWRGFGL